MPGSRVTAYRAFRDGSGSSLSCSTVNVEATVAVCDCTSSLRDFTSTFSVSAPTARVAFTVPG
jgi:hypothetical protein